MQWLQAQTSNAATPGVILHLGAGLCQELDIWRATGAPRIILVEPNPEIFPELRREAEGSNNIEVLPAAVSDEPGRRALRLYNYPDLSSLRRPTGLAELLPGLQQTGQAIVNVIAAHTLPEQLGLRNDESNWLVIDTPGEEAAILSALEQHQQLHCFDRIFIRAGAESFYDSALSAEQLIRQLDHLGYYIEGAGDTSDRDWPRYHVRLNPKAIECRRLRRENAALTEHQAQLEKRNQELTERLGSTQQQAEQQKKDLTAKNGELQAKLEEFDKGRQEAQQRAEEFKTQRDDLGARLEKQIEELKSKLEQAEKSREQVQQQLEQVTQSRDNLQKNLQKHNEETHKLRIRASRLEEENEDYQERHKLLEEELIKAEAQIDLIKQMFLSGDDALDFEEELERD